MRVIVDAKALLDGRCLVAPPMLQVATVGSTSDIQPQQDVTYVDVVAAAAAILDKLAETRPSELLKCIPVHMATRNLMSISLAADATTNAANVLDNHFGDDL